VKALTLIFVILIALLQYPLWLGKGSWLRVWNVNQQIDEQKDKNAAFKQRNATLNAEVRDLKQGSAAIEERARTELGMIKQDEVFYQVIDQALPVKPINQVPAEIKSNASNQSVDKATDKATEKPTISPP
jgi:cell division protein FtsB